MTIIDTNYPYSKQTGTSILAIVVGLCVTAALGLTGWYVVHARTSPPVANSTPSGTPDTATTVPNEPGETDKYLVIEEWGVRFVLPEALRGDIEYGIRKNVDMSSIDDATPLYGDTAYFASKKIAAVQAGFNDCGLKPGAQDDSLQRPDPNSYDGGPGVTLTRTTRQVTLPGQDYRIGDYWYEISKGSAAACYEGSDGSLESKFIHDTLEALKTIEALPTNQ